MKIIKTLGLCLIYTTQIYSQNVKGLVDSNNAFAFKLYNEVEKKDSNILFSPYNVSLALAMTYNGARNVTAQEMCNVLNFSLEKESFNKNFKSLNDKIDSLGKKNGFDLNLSNSIWIETGFKPLKSFSDIIYSQYQAEINLVDYINEIERSKAVKKINEWVERKTKDRVKDLLNDGAVNYQTRLVLISTIYFKSNWAIIFDRSKTKHEDFYLSASKKEMVDYMNITSQYKYYNDSLLQVIEIPYSGDKVSMLIFLPKNKEDFITMEKQVNSEYYKSIVKSFQSDGYLKQKIQLSLPKFRISKTLPLKNVLSTLGMPSAFSKESADFSGITGNKQLCISGILQQSFIDVTEEGTEAAAATAIVDELRKRELKNNPPIIFNVNHTFMFLIKDNLTGSILFMGKIMNPTNEK